MNTRTIRSAIVATAASIAMMPALSLGDSIISAHAPSLAQDPVVMRLSKDEFRIVFGINATACGHSERGCNGTIRYRVDWKTEDGLTRSETKRVAYAVAPHSARGVAVDRQYFDTAEGAHNTEVIKVSVTGITSADGIGSNSTGTVALAAAN